MTIERRLETAIQAAVSAGALLMKHYYDKLNVSKKESLRDIATEVDNIVEGRIIEVITNLEENASIFAEEGGVIKNTLTNQYWLIDALDGTVNYVNHIPFFAVSISFVDNGQPVMGVIYNPMLSDLYYGAEGIGVFKNQERLKIKDNVPEQSVFSVAFSGKNYDPARRKDEFLLMAEINDLSRGCLRTGSASMNLALLADGRLGGCWGKANKFWDVAAGLVIARLAGAQVDFVFVEPSKNKSTLVSYVAAVPSSWNFISRKVVPVLGLAHGVER